MADPKDIMDSRADLGSVWDDGGDDRHSARLSILAWVTLSIAAWGAIGTAVWAIL